MVTVSVFLVINVLLAGVLFLRLHTLPERMAHRGHKLQFEIVAVLGLLALFTHVHLFWVAALLLAMIDLPDFSGSLGRMVRSLEKIADRSENPEAQSSTPVAASREVAGPAEPRNLIAPPAADDITPQAASQAETARA